MLKFSIFYFYIVVNYGKKLLIPIINIVPRNISENKNDIFKVQTKGHFQLLDWGEKVFDKNYNVRNK